MMPATAHHTSATLNPMENHAGSSSPDTTRRKTGSGRSTSGGTVSEGDAATVIVWGDRAPERRTFGGA